MTEQTPLFRVPVKIEKVLEIEGARDPILKEGRFVYAHISTPTEVEGKPVQYALIAGFPQHGTARLGNIDPETKVFKWLTQEPFPQAFYERASNHVIQEMRVPAGQLDQLKTVDEVLAIEGIKVRRELIPE